MPGLRRLDAAGLREVEPAATGVAALHSPHTAAVDYPAVCRALAADVAGAGGEVLLGRGVDEVRATAAGGQVRLAGGEVRGFDAVVVCAGLGSDRLARGLGRRATCGSSPSGGSTGGFGRGRASSSGA